MPEQPTPAKRIRAADLIAEQRATIAALLSRGGGENSSVVLTRNAKGEVQIEVTVRTDQHELTTADLAYSKAVELFDRAQNEYPYARSSEPKAGG